MERTQAILGCNGSIVNWEPQESMTKADIESGIGSWSRRENRGRFIADGPKNEKANLR
jgi:hypothetical protein